MGSAHLRAGMVGVLETDPTGHRLQYLRHLVEAAGPDRSVVLTTERAVGSEEFAAHAAGLGVRTLLLPSHGSPRSRLAAAVTSARLAGVTRVIIPDGDQYLSALLLMLLRRPGLPIDVRLLLMRTTEVGGPEPVRLAMIIKPLLVQMLRPFSQVRVRFLTDALGVVSSRRGYPGVPGAPDPVQRAGEPGPRPVWFPPVDPSMTVIGVFGVISPRKNLPLLVEAFTAAPDFSLVVGGRLEPEVREELEGPAARALVDAGRMVVQDRLLPPAEFAAALAAVDAVAVLHDNDSPSGILAEACLRGTPVVVPEGGWLARVVDATNLGVTTRMDAPAVAEALARLATNRSAHVAAIHRQASRLGTARFTELLLS